MSYELNINMKCPTPLLLDDVKNCLIPLVAVTLICFEELPLQCLFSSGQSTMGNFPSLGCFMRVIGGVGL